VHETGHALFCLLFGHRITGIKLFDFAPRDGTRGHVSHTFDPANPWQQVGNFFIGIAPILFGTLAIVAAARWLLGAEALGRMAEPLPQGGLLRTAGDWLALARHVAAGAGTALAALLDPHRLLGWRAWLFLYLTLTIGNSISLSGADLKGALAGFVTLLILVVLANLATLWLGDVLGAGVAWLARWQAVGYAAMLFALAVNALVALALLAIPGPASR
jgi:Na+/phosphate symporter